MATRIRDTVDSDWPIHLFQFVEHVLVECPKCAACAAVECRGAPQGVPTVTCPSCAFTKRGWPPPAEVEMRRDLPRRCPRCNEGLGKAPVRHLARKQVVEVACRCGAVSFAEWRGARMYVGTSTDPYFRLPLWFRANVQGNELWAYNRDHLAFLDAYVRATLRERTPNRNGSLMSRLPRWLKAAPAREEVLKTLARMARRTA